jgi:hypothetical protein
MARAREKVDSVCDFLYVDARRIGILISQLDGGDDGVVTELSRQVITSSEASGAVSVAVVKGDYKEGENVALFRKFDPQWLTPLRFLDLAQDMIVKDLAAATLGQLVIKSGSLSLLDHSILLKVLADRAIRGGLQLESGNDYMQTINSLGVTNEEFATKKPAEKQKLRRQAAELIWGVIGSLPLRTQMIVDGEAGKVWGVLREENLVMSYNELAITHGASIPGEWTVVGLLDAGTSDLVADEGAVMALPEGLARATKGVSTMVRKIVGRPADTFAVTPLIVYRKVTG